LFRPGASLELSITPGVFDKQIYQVPVSPATRFPRPCRTYRQRRNSMFKSIIVPVDVGDLSVARLALRSASKLADADASVTLIHVVPVLPLTMLDTVSVTVEDELADTSKLALADLGRELELPRGSVFTVVRVGGVYNEVLALANEQGADLIVVGSHQPSMATLLLGSNSSAIVRHAPCSVMVVREQQAMVKADVSQAMPAPAEELPGVNGAVPVGA
jgi:nucleotide-binding universal stress UspA family protein